MSTEEPWQKRERETNEWFARIDRPLPEANGFSTIDDFDPWDLFPGCVGAYSSSIDELAIRVLKAVQNRTTFELLEGPDAIAAELFMHMLAGRLCSYGTSPRGVYPGTEVIRARWPEFIEKWEAYAALKWGDDE